MLLVVEKRQTDRHTDREGERREREETERRGERGEEGGGSWKMDKIRTAKHDLGQNLNLLTKESLVF